MSSPETQPTPIVPFQELQVPGEPGVWTCARHKAVKTRLRCGRCEKPICPKCTIMAPTGARCSDCASNRSSHVYQVSPLQYLLAFVVSLGMGAVGALAAPLASGALFLLFLYAPAIGPVWARIITKITGGKRGPKVAMVVSLGLVLGALLCAFVPELLVYSQTGYLPGTGLEGMDGDVPLTKGAHPPATPLALLIPLLLMGHITVWIFLAVAIAGVWWSLK